MSVTSMTTLTFILSALFPLMVLDATSCVLQDLNGVKYIIIILYSYDKQVLMMYPKQE